MPYFECCNCGRTRPFKVYKDSPELVCQYCLIPKEAKDTTTLVYDYDSEKARWLDSDGIPVNDKTNSILNCSFGLKDTT